jgi:hypothetical protein
MTILPNGTAIYFNPRAIPTRAEELAVDLGEGDPVSLITDYPLGSYAEFSVGHPEQVGRNTYEQRDTVSPVANLRGEIIRAIPEGTTNLLITTAGIYRVGFQRAVIIAEVSPTLGVAAPDSVIESSIGAFWFSHEGVIWLRGGKTVFLDEQLGFGKWFDDIAVDDRDDVAIGNVESLSQLIVTVPGFDKALCYDYGRNFASEFTGSDMTFTKAAYFEGQLFSDSNVYPEGENPSVATQVEAWLSEEVNRPKQLKWVEVKVGPGSGGNVTLTVEARQHPDERPDYAHPTITFDRTYTITPSSSGQKLRMHDFLNTRARMFRFKLSAPQAVDWGLQELRCEFEYDDTEDARSA